MLCLGVLFFAACNNSVPEPNTSELLETYSLNESDITQSNSRDHNDLIQLSNNEVVVLAGFPDIELISFHEGLVRKWDKLFESDGLNNSRKILDVGDGLVIIGTKRNQQFNTPDLLIFKTNYQGELIFEYVEENQFYFNGVSILQNSDDELVFIAHKKNSEKMLDTSLVLGKLSKSGKLVWSKEYSLEDNIIAKEILEGPEGDFVVLTAHDLTLNEYSLFKFDSGGDFKEEIQTTISSFSTAFNVNHNSYNITNTEDGGYLLVCDLPYDQNGPYFESTVVKLDQEFKIQWEIETPHLSPSGVIQTKDRGFLSYGGTSFDGETGSIYFIKLDQQGEIIWEREFEISGEYISARKVIESREGELIVLGSSVSTFDFVIFKTDSEGRPF